MLQMIDHHPVLLSDFQWGNLQTLYDYLVENRELVEPHFNMKFYMFTTDFTQLKLDAVMPAPKIIHECGSIGCLIGHSPLAGIPPKNGEQWDFYAHRVFGAGHLEKGFQDGQPLWDWLFGAHWSRKDNTLDGALERLSYTILHRAVPKEYA